MNKQLGKRFIEEMRKLHDYTRDQKTAIKRKHDIHGTLSSLSSEDIQNEVIDAFTEEFMLKGSNYENLLKNRAEDMILNLDETLNSFTENFIRSTIGLYRSIERGNENPVVKRYVKVAVKEKSPKKENRFDTVFLEKWYADLYSSMKSGKQRAIQLDNSAKYVSNLSNLLAFPVRIIDVPVTKYYPEKDLRTVVITNPKEFLPQTSTAENKLLTSKDYVFLNLANVVEFEYPSNAKFKPVYRFSTRVKISGSDALKWATYAAGYRDDPHTDSVGSIIETDYENIPFIKQLLKDVSSDDEEVLNNNTSSRYPLFKENYLLEANEIKSDEINNYKKLPSYTVEEYSAILKEVKKTVYDIINRADDIADAMSFEDYKKFIQPYLIMGEWIDMTEAETGEKMEVQIKTPTSMLLYGWNSPSGHNSKLYHGFRNNDLIQRLKEKDAHILTNFYEKVILKAFQMSQKKSQFSISYSR